MVTYQELFQFCMLIVGIITLVLPAYKKEVRPPSPKLSVLL